MKAYKATYNQKCKGFSYEVGKTYSVDGDISLCDWGFHCCEKVDDVLTFYPYIKDKFVLLEIEVLGKVIKGGDKMVTSEFKVLRIVPPSEYNKIFKRVKFYKDGTIKYRVDYDSFFHWDIDKYNEVGKLIFRLYCDGYWFKYAYSNNSRIVDRKGTYGKLRRLVNSIKIKIGFIT